MSDYEKKKLLRDALKAVSHLQHRLDQIKECRDEGRELNNEEWAEIRALVGEETP